MRCPQCGTENPAGQKFCGSCGNALAAVCGSCGSTNPPGQRFCANCGAYNNLVDFADATDRYTDADQLVR